MRKIAFIVAILTMLTMLGGLTYAGERVKAPTYHIGDKWTYRIVDLTGEYITDYKVVDEDTVERRDCWVLEVTYSPPSYMGTFSAATVWYDQERGPILPVKVQLWGVHQGMPCVNVMINSYDFEGKPFPLEVGREFKVINSSEMTLTRLGETDSTTLSSIDVYKVEGKDDITTPAGKFSCFRIVQYNGFGQKTAAMWYSEELKNNVGVKNIDPRTGRVIGTQMLNSYSLSEGG
jgi:hypothetical protein